MFMINKAIQVLKVSVTSQKEKLQIFDEFIPPLFWQLWI